MTKSLYWRWGLWLAVLLPLLQGCVGVVATGVVGAVLVSNDRRTTGTLVEDEAIESKLSGRISEKLGDRVHINVNTYNRMVLLTGEASTPELKSEVEAIARAVENVRGVYNEITIAGASDLQARSNDAYISSKVRARLVDTSEVSALHVQVTTEARVVYLMGLVTQGEAKAAAQAAATTAGVAKVVTLFEIVPDSVKTPTAPNK